MKYYVNQNAQVKGEHEVHSEICGQLPNLENRIFLGDFTNCADAVKTARYYYTDVDGCKFCCPLCHKK